VPKRIISAVKMVEFVSDRMSYIKVLNTHASRDDKIGDVKESFSDESEQTDKNPQIP
jgi:hypothetical protein